MNRQWVVARASESEGMCLEPEVFGQVELPIPKIGKGQILIQNQLLVCEPLVHAMVKGVPGRIEPLAVGSVFRGHAGGVVVQSLHPDFKEGDEVHGTLDWSDFVLSDGFDGNGLPLSRCSPQFNLSTNMITLGMTGLCAFIGLFEIGRPLPGDAVAVSAAAGGVGSIAIQLAKIAGCKTIGIAGGPRKTASLREKLGVEIALDYKNTDLASDLGSASPKGINVFFDNVGGDVLDAVLINLAKFGRVAVCGGIGGYDNAEAVVRNTTLLTQKNGLVQGFWYSDYEHIFERALDAMSGWIRSGELQELTDVAKGFESVPRSVRGIFAGENLGKQLVELS